MPLIDFNNVDDVQDFSPLPEGKYRCRVAEVDETTRRSGDAMWKLRLAVESGPRSSPARTGDATSSTTCSSARRRSNG